MDCDSGEHEACALYVGHQIQRYYKLNLWHEFQKTNFILLCGY